ncbi:MAG: 5-formyltetrahydrofolate cyclo-ligase [Alphaproteobacteria bacterium]|nr:5-formyltetrahydrofolate cyclo-ligase [Alphaproteobacteria bacterium]
MVASQKKTMRLMMKEQRRMLFKQHPRAGEVLSDLFFDSFDFPKQTLFGAYWPIGSELDIRPLLYELMEKGFRCALPCLTQEGLLFHLWTLSTPLQKGPFHVLEPSSTVPTAIPNVLLVPLLAFDRQGHRLGYGQGHFDRFLHQHKVITIGIGFKGQEVDRVPHQAHDFSLDYILTEEEIISCTPLTSRA